MAMPDITYEYEVNGKVYKAPSLPDLLKWLARKAKNGNISEPIIIRKIGVRELDRDYAASRA